MNPFDHGFRPPTPYIHQPETVKRPLIGFDRQAEGTVKIKIVTPLGFKREKGGVDGPESPGQS